MGKMTAEGMEEADLSSADMETSERTCRSRRVRDPVRRAGGGGHESGLPAGREKYVSEASQDGLLEEIGSKARM